MAQTSELDKLKARSDSSDRIPIPELTAQPLPIKLAQIDPIGAEEWLKGQQARFNEFTRKLNATLPLS